MSTISNNYETAAIAFNNPYSTTKNSLYSSISSGSGKLYEVKNAVIKNASEFSATTQEVAKEIISEISTDLSSAKKAWGSSSSKTKLVVAASAIFTLYGAYSLNKAFSKLEAHLNDFSNQLPWLQNSASIQSITSFLIGCALLVNKK